MKTIKFLKVNLMAIVAIICVSSIMSFNSPEKKTEGEYHYYNNSSLSSFNTLTKWSLVNDSESCISDGGRPCKIFVPDGQTLDDVIGGKTDPYIMQEAEGTKE